MIVHDLRAAQRGRRLNAMFLALRDEPNRAAFQADKDGFHERFGLTAGERSLVDRRDWDGLMRAGLSVYALGKALPALGSDFVQVGADLHGVERAEFVRARRQAARGE